LLYLKYSFDYSLTGDHATEIFVWDWSCCHRSPIKMFTHTNVSDSVTEICKVQFYE